MMNDIVKGTKTLAHTLAVHPTSALNIQRCKNKTWHGQGRHTKIVGIARVSEQVC